jgi:P-type Ca2+ transporter type 2C
MSLGEAGRPARATVGRQAGVPVPRAADLAGGLTSAEAAARLAEGGRNVLPAPRPVPLWHRAFTQFRDPLVLVLLVAAVLTTATGDWADACVIALVIGVNTAAGVTQEVKADRAISALSQITAPEARVLRDGSQRQIPAAEVVAGDVLVLAEGDIVPADAHVLAAAALLVDESALTGESVPAGKEPGDGSQGSVVSAGTVVVHGRGRAVVTATGTASAMGRAAALMSAGSGLTPLQRRMAAVGRALAAAAVALCVIVLALGLARGQSAELMIVTAISLVVAAVPESLPAVVTLALALGARRMTARNALIRRLPAVETLGSVTVLGTDKTGTLTEGSMAVRRLWAPGGGTLTGGGGRRPPGAPGGDGQLLDVTAGQATAHLGEPGMTRLLTAAALCNDAALRPPGDGDRWTAIGDPTEAALLTAAAAAGLRPGQLAASMPRVGEVPFDSGRKRMTTVHRRAAGGVLVICKGAPETLLAPAVLADDPAAVARASVQAQDMAHHGLRVLAVAAAPRPAMPAAGDLERGLRLLGLIGIADPPRRAAAATIASCQAAGITPLLITGDHPATARAVATELGILHPGEDVADCSDPGTSLGGRRTRVFARATPEQKLAIISARQAAGDVVAMTGDGVNDGPALRRADIGVAMGRRGTEVARQAADLVLADDNLATVVTAVGEGRRVYANIRRFLLYALSGGSAEIAVMLAGPALGFPLPLLPSQILWVNLLTHGLPGVALGGEPGEPGVMSRPPRPPAESVLGAGLWQRILRVGLVIAAVTLGAAVWGHATGRPWQSMAFFALGTTQLAVALGSRARPGSLANPLLPVAVAAALALQLAGLYLPLLRELLHTTPLTLTDLAVVFGASTLGYAAIRLDRIVFRAGRGPHASRAQMAPHRAAR